MMKSIRDMWRTHRDDRAGKDERPSKGPKRKSVVPVWRRPLAQAVGVLVVISVLGGGAGWALKSGRASETWREAKWAAIELTAEQGFTVEDVLVTGRGETARADLLEALNVARGAPILAFDFDAAHGRVEALPWVLSARIERLLPDTLVVHLIERRPLALWQNEGRFALIDEEGRVIQREGLGRFSNLIHIVGRDAPDHVAGLLELLGTQPALKHAVKAAVRVGGRRWDLLLAGGVRVHLPEVGAPRALARLAAFERETGVLGREVKALDLRIPDRVIVSTPADVRTKPKETAKGQQT